MKVIALKTKLIIALGAVVLAALVAGFCFMGSKGAFAESNGYNESYRNLLSYSAKAGWNNDPNGLLYVNGTYHMYYQYNWDGRNNSTQNGWGHMSWGHATSSDLVHWEEQPVAIPAYWDGENVEYMMFSGSAVYDERNTSGLFDVDGSGKVSDGQGIVAILTQPSDKDGGQRQILAYSKDGGNSFTIHGEILGANAEGSLGDGEFRDPKVFRNEKSGKWLMAVGGGSVRMYSSDNLKDWDYLGETGYWGECPDVSRFEVEGEEKYVLIISPEDKSESHEYNGTNRADTYYPAEYYVVGELDGNGLFHGSQPLTRLSEGIDCYAFQSFNNAEDGKVYGISWSASWLTVGLYEGYRQGYNGGMTVACELQLVKDGDGYALLRTPVSGYEALRDGELKTVTGKADAGANPLAGVKATEADIDLELDFTDSAATYTELSLRVSAEEKIVLRYGVADGVLSLDRTQSSLIAKDTNFYKDVYKKQVPLEDGKLRLRILLDRAFISVFANGGKASFFSAVFPSAISDGMNLSSDGEVGASAQIYNVKSIFGDVTTRDELILTTTKIDGTVGSKYAVIGSSYAAGFDAANVQYALTDGSDNVALEVKDGTAYISALKKGYAQVKVSYGGFNEDIKVYIYENGFKSDVNYTDGYRAFSYLREDGLFLGAGETDAFLFGDEEGESFTYSANFTPQENAQAGGLAFGYTGNASGYFFATADIKENKVKLVRFRGEKEAADTLQTADCTLPSGAYKLTVKVDNGTASVSVNGNKVIEYKLENYAGGRVGLNVFNANMVVNDVYFSADTDDNGVVVGNDEIVKIVNVTDGSYRLKDGDYTVSDGRLTVSESYLSTLEENTEYTFRVVTADSDFDFVIKTDFTAATLIPSKQDFSRGDSISFTVSGSSEVYKLEINGTEREFTLEGNVITVAAEALKDLTGGTYVAKAYTANGRPTASFGFAGLPDFQEAEVEAVNRVFFWVDIAIFGALIIGYVAFSIVKRCKRG